MSIIVVAPNYPAFSPSCQPSNMGQAANPEVNRHPKPEVGTTAACGCKGHCMCGKTNNNLSPNNTLDAQLNRLEMKQNQLYNLQMQTQAQLAQVQARLNIQA